MHRDAINVTGGHAVFRLQVLESVDSTNEVIKRAIEEGEPEGLAVRAFRQTGGYGRQGRAWKSPEGGMYESILLRPKVEMRELPTLALVAALAVRRALASLVVCEEARRIRIKWPNDVVLVDRDALAGRAAPSQPRDRSVRSLYSKLCGISSEVHAGGVCIGIGVNVEPPCERVEVGGKNAPAYLADLGFGFTCEHKAAIAEVGDAVLAEFEPLYAAWCEGGFAMLAGEFAEHSMLEGHFVSMANQAGDVVCEGVVAGVDAQGRLLLSGQDGSTVAVSSGEVHLL